MSLFTFGFDSASQGLLTRLIQALSLSANKQEENTMAVIQSVSDLITANQTLIALVNQLITKLGTPSPDVSDTAAAATSELSAVNAAITAAQAALTPPPQT